MLQIRPSKKFLYFILLFPIILATCKCTPNPPKERNDTINKHCKNKDSFNIEAELTPFVKSNNPWKMTSYIGVSSVFLNIKAVITLTKIQSPIINRRTLDDE